METSTDEFQRVYPTRLDASGRIVLPRELRELWHLSAGDGLSIIQDKEGCRIETSEMALKKAQAYFKSLVPAGVSLVDELLAERHAEVEREKAEEANANDGES